MFNERIQDNTDKCNIIKHSLLDDLLDYTVIGTSNSITLQFSDNTSSSVTSRISELATLATDTTTLETWQPLFIENDNLVKTKMLSDYGAHLNSNPSLNSGRIGIEDFYTFTPQFKHWNNTGGVMSVDWILNKSNCPYAINYGILGWYRIIDSANSRSIGGTAKPIESFPNGSRLKHSSQPDKIYIKISDDTLRDIAAQPNTLSSTGSWTFNDETTAGLKDIATFGQNATFTLSDIYYETELANPTASPRKHTLINSLLGSVNSYLWIPDGDFFSYYYSDSDKQISLAAKIPSCSYVSASLYNQYSNIYRILTLDEPRLFNKKDLRKARAYKKLAHSLSTGPFVHDFSIHALDYIEIRKLIQKYIGDQKNITTITQELNTLKTALLNISKTLQTTIVANNSTGNTNRSLYLDTKSSFITHNNNLIRNSEQLFKKLLTKYGAKLLVNGTTTLSPKPNTLKYNNDGIVITQVLDSYVSKDTRNTTVYNTQNIAFDNTIIAVDTAPDRVNKLSIVNGSEVTNVPLADCAKPGYGTISNINIILPYKSYVQGIFRNDGILLQEQGTIDTYIFESDLDGSRGIDLSALSIIPEIRSRGETGQFNEELYLESKIGVIWEQLGGPSGSFQEVNGIPGVSPDTKFYTSKSGKFVVQCTASTPFGTYTKIKTFYVIDGRQVIPPLGGNPNYGKYEILNLDGTSRWEFPPSVNPYAAESTPIYLNKDNLRVQTTKINSIGIHNMAGVVWPIRTNLQIREDTGALGRTRAENIFDLSADYKFTYKTNYTSRTNNPLLQLIFNSNNTVIKIHSVFLEKIRTNERGCENCISFYEPKMVARNDVIFSSNSIGENTSFSNISRYFRSNKSPSDFILLAYKRDPNSNDMTVDKYITFIYPNISTDFAPNIKSYGGYSTNFVNTIIKDPIPDHPFPNDTATNTIVSNNSPVLPTVSGYKLDYRNDKNSSLLKMCYQKPLISVPPTGSIMQFTKGVFHPSSGWIPYSGTGYQVHANRCGLLKFNPGARDSFSFLGPSLSSIKNRNIDIPNNTIDQKIFSSTISLSIAKEVQWDPDCSCGNDISGNDPDAGTVGTPRYNDNQKHKEYADIHYHVSNHGYRNLAGGVPKQSERTVLNNTSFVNDEFLTEHDAKNSSISYSFAVTGPSIMPTVVAPDGKIMLRNPRVNDFGIKDIEVKLNFLNYVNTKNLVVWLEVDYTADEQKTRYPPNAKKPISPLKASKEFLDQSFDANLYAISGSSYTLSSLNDVKNSVLANYLSSLTDMNSNKVGTPLKLYLLNQENIEHNQFNFCVKFSDSASKYNTPYDTNILPSPTGSLNATPITPSILNYMLSSGVSFVKNNENSSQQAIYQTVINNTDSLQPTIAATGYTDRECCVNGSIIRHNKINITNNTFSKFVAKSLFKGIIPERGPCPPEFTAKQKQPDFNGRTTFTLKMMVLDETDDMYPNDNIDYQYKTGLDTTNNDSLSCSIVNSLCNWELVLHVGPVHKPLPHTSPSVASYGNTDILSLINYDTDPQYPGYSFMADLSAYKHLLPLANLNAPYSCIADHHTCLSNDGFVAAGALSLRPPEFPTYAILQIMASIAAAAGMSGGTLVGVLGGLDSIINNPGWNDIYNFFRENRFFEQLIDSSRELYAPMYHKYPFGSPEKMLVLFRKAQGLWYNAEATMLKYHNSPILKLNKYKFIKVQRNNGKYISEFKYNIVNDFNDLIDQHNIKELDCACGDWSSVKTTSPIEYSGLLIQKGDLVNVNLVPSTGAGCSGHNGLYVIPISTDNNIDWIKITESNLDQLSQAIHFSTQNAVLCGGKPFFDSTLSSALSGNKVIMSPSRIPYDLFSINDTIESYTQGDSAPSVPLSIVNKALLFKNNKYFSVFSLDKSAASGNTLSPSSGDHVFFVFDNKTSIEDKITKQYNIWGLDQNKELVGSQITQIQPNTHSAGSYGDLSLFLEKNLLSSNIRYNHLEQYHTILNNKINDKIKYNQIKIYDKDNVAQTGFKAQSCYGFAYSEKDLSPHIFDTKNLSYYITPEYLRPDGDPSAIFDALDSQTQWSTSTENEIPYRYGYIKAKVYNANSGLPTGVLYGELTIENDFVEHIPMRMLTTTEITQLQTRLLLIDDDKFTGVDNSIGIPEDTTTVLQSNNLHSILKHYKSLPDDPSHCYRPNDTKSNLCYKKKTEQKINDLYLERKEIIDLLDYQTVRMISLSYTDSNNATQSINGEILYENNSYITIKPLSATTSTKIAKNSIVTTTPVTRTFQTKTTLPTTHRKWISDSILPKISPTIQTDNTTQAITITYDAVNTDHYWINIDPKQSTFKDFEKNPKILVDTTYICQLANPLLIQTPVMKNNVCPFSTSTDLPVGWDANLDISFKQNSPTSYTYSVHSGIIDAKKESLKSLHPSIKDWRLFTKVRYFNVNGDQTLDIAPALEIIVQAKENYLIPITDEDLGILEYDDQSADTSNVGGISVCPGGSNQGSPGGYGLLTTYGERLRKPSRVCNIINLDNTNNIDVMVKRIPRILRGVDLLATIYRYGSKSVYRQSNPSNPLVPTEIDLAAPNGAINNSLYYWTCYQTNPNTKLLEKALLPNFFLLQNEMMFRAFFGSVDKIENRTDVAVSSFPWELIPYEYSRPAE